MPVGIDKDFPSRIICAIIPYKFRVQAIGYEMSFFISGNTIFFTSKLKLHSEMIAHNSNQGSTGRKGGLEGGLDADQGISFYGWLSILDSDYEM